MMILLMKKIATKASSITIESILKRPENSSINSIPSPKIIRKNPKRKEDFQRKVLTSSFP